MFAVVHVDEATEISRLEHEWRTSVTAIRAAAEILRDYDGLATFEQDRFVQAIIEESGRLTRAFENVSEFR
jgi:signal transduction histidine kinase